MLEPDDTGNPVGSIVLAPDTELDYPNILRVKIDLLDQAPVPASTGTYLLTDTVVLKQNSSPLGSPTTMVFGSGEMIFLGVPPGTIEVSVPNTAEYTFGSDSITLGTGVDETITITAQNDITGNLIFAPRGPLPGTIVGYVYNSSDDPDSLLAGAQMVSIQGSLKIASYTVSQGNGSYFFANVSTGDGEIYALSGDGTIEGLHKEVFIDTGQVYGDNDPSPEDTDLFVPLSGGDSNFDSDFDGLPDSWESTYLGSVPSDERGPLDDPDGDGLTNMEEYQIGTDPDDQDTDGDGFDDGVEVAMGSDPDNGNSTPAGQSEIWLDFGFSGDIEVGTLLEPVNNITDALLILTPGGTIIIKGDVDTTSGTAPGNEINSAVTLDANNGVVELNKSTTAIAKEAGYFLTATTGDIPWFGFVAENSIADFTDYSLTWEFYGNLASSGDASAGLSLFGAPNGSQNIVYRLDQTDPSIEKLYLGADTADSENPDLGIDVTGIPVIIRLSRTGSTHVTEYSVDGGANFISASVTSPVGGPGSLGAWVWLGASGFIEVNTITYDIGGAVTVLDGGLGNNFDGPAWGLGLIGFDPILIEIQ